MLYKIRFRPAFATLFVTLNPDESIITEVGTMISMDSGIKVKTTMGGGLISAFLRKFLARESLLVNVYTNKSDEPKSLILSQRMIGDIERIDLKRGGICVQRGAYLAHTSEVKMKLSFAGFGSLLGGEGLFKLKFTGKGRVFIGSYGGITKRVLYTDFIVDNGHLLAYEPSVRLKPRLAAKGLGNLTSGEGVVNHLKGKGIFYLQSRSLDRLVRHIRKNS